MFWQLPLAIHFTSKALFPGQHLASEKPVRAYQENASISSSHTALLFFALAATNGPC